MVCAAPGGTGAGAVVSGARRGHLVPVLTACCWSLARNVWIVLFDSISERETPGVTGWSDIVLNWGKYLVQNGRHASAQRSVHG